MINFIECSTERRAYEAVEDFRTQQESVFCPIIKGNCNVFCVCYSAPRTYKNYEGRWFAYNMGCSSPMIMKQEV
jgi:hypothetical protein